MADVRENIMKSAISFLHSSQLSPDQLATDLVEIIRVVRANGNSISDITDVEYVEGNYEVKILHTFSLVIPRKVTSI